MLIRTTTFRTLVALFALTLAAPTLASGAPASDLAARLDASNPSACIDANDPALETRVLAAAAAGGACDQWYRVNSLARKLVDSCEAATEHDYAEVEAQALINTNNFGTRVCRDLGCVHTMSGVDPIVDCSCENRLLMCNVKMTVYCASP